MNTYCIDLESGSTQHLSRADEANLSITGDLTIEMWVQFESLPANNVTGMYGVSKSGASPQRGYGFFIQQSGGVYQMGFTITSDGTNITTKTVTWTPTAGVWYHIAVVYDASAGSADFYVNGVAQGSQQTGLPTSIYDNNTDFRIGVEEGVGYFDGKIDDVRLWSATRTVAQILANYRTEIDSATNLKGSWHLNNVLTDSSGNSLTLTNNGTAVFSTQVPFIEFTDTTGISTEDVIWEHAIAETDTAGAPTESMTNKYGFGGASKSSAPFVNIPKS